MSEPVLVSIGPDIRRPGDLHLTPLSDMLSGIGEGRWGEPVERVRALEYRSPEQREAKEVLPYFTPSGAFRYRNAGGLLTHSGHVAIDVDDLAEDEATRTIQRSVADPFCRAAFRSATGRGVRLMFGCPPCSPDAHRIVFGRVADHVRSVYGVEPDTSGKDVSRACFVSFDKGIWLNPSAITIPGLEQIAETTHKDKVLVCSSGADVVTLAVGLGESRAPREVRGDGSVATHLALRDLARDLVVRFRRHNLDLSQADIERAARSWWRSAKSKGLTFRGAFGEYHAELGKAVRSVERVHWLSRVINFWLRWTRHADFPTNGTSAEKLAFAIRQHCREQDTNTFFLSARDAATVTGTTFRAANDTLHALCRAEVIERTGKRQHARHAQSYRLLKP